jgi:ribonuclease Z
MQPKRKTKRSGLSRRQALKLSGLALGGLATVSTSGKGGEAKVVPAAGCYPTAQKTQVYEYYENLPWITPWEWDINGNVMGTKLEENEMRITFMGSTVPMPRRAQAEMSIFVEVGWNDSTNKPEDQFIFDFGCGVSANYQAAGVDFGRMDKIFINHLHADHVSDLVHVYGFGDGADRKSPLYIFGQGPTTVPNPGMGPAITNPLGPPANNYPSTPATYQDGLTTFCYHLREMLRWHTESQAFQGSAYRSYPSLEQIASDWGLPYVPSPVSDDPPNDANAIIPIELDWTIKGLDANGIPTYDNIAYHNASTRAMVTHYPVMHCRQGAMGYKLVWTPRGGGKPLTMIYSSDTKPEWNSINQAINKDTNGIAQGVDVFIHEMAVAPAIWAMKMMGLSAPGSGPYWDSALAALQAVQDSSHTPQGAFGYVLSQIKPRPRLAVATHFPTSNDTVACALESVNAQCPDITREGEQMIWSFDLMVLRVFPDKILQCKARVNDFSYNPPIPPSDLPRDLYAPKYHTAAGAADPFAQLDLTGATDVQIQSTQNGGYNGKPTFDESGY